jgi:3',5'-cyclic AMP phosphodiesterase CpdA
MTVTIAQISDPHLSGTKSFFVQNFDHAAEALRASRPDLLINTGDLSLDGADTPADLAFAREKHDAIGLPWRAIAGNHDVGDSRELKPSQPVDAARLARWPDVIGDCFWREDVAGWRLLGIDAMLLGSGLPEDHAQADFIRAAAETLAGRSLLLFIHKPLFIDDPAEEGLDGMFLTPGPRRDLLAALGGMSPRLIASGHVHQWRDTARGGTRLVWAPGLSFVTPPWMIPAYGVRTIGFVEHRLESDGGYSSWLVGVGRTVIHDIEDFPACYGDLGPARAAAERRARGVGA